MDFLIRLEKILTQLLEWILVLLFGFFLIMVCVLVLLRYGFSTSIFGGNELVTIAFIFTSAIGGALCITKNEHIAITFLIDQLPHSLKLACYIVGMLLIAIINGYMIYYSYNWISMAGHNPWQPLGWPQGIVHAVIPVGCGLAIFYSLLKALLALTGRTNIDVAWMPED